MGISHFVRVDANGSDGMFPAHPTPALGGILE
jgi:hypothetical protein